MKRGVSAKGVRGLMASADKESADLSSAGKTQMPPIDSSGAAEGAALDDGMVPTAPKARKTRKTRRGGRRTQGVVAMIRSYARANSRLLLLYLVIMLAINMAYVGSGYFLGRTVDSVASGDPALITRRFLLLTLLLWAALPPLSLANNLTDRRFMPGLTTHMRTGVVLRVMDAFRRRPVEQRVGDVMSKLVKVPLTTVMLATQCREHFVPATLAMLVTTAYLFWVHPALGGLLLLGLVLFAVVTTRKLRHTFRQAHLTDSLADATAEATADMLSQMANVHANDAQRAEMARLAVVGDQLARQQRRALLSVTCSRVTFDTFYLALMGSVLALAVWLARTRKISPGTVASVGFIMSFAVFALDDVSRESALLATNVGTLTKTDEYLTSLAAQEVAAPDGTLTDAPADGTVVIRGVVARYDPAPAPPLYNGVHLTVAHGERVLLRGPNGTGKSTLLALLMGNLPYEAGSVTVGGVEVSATEARVLRSRVVLVPQRPDLFDRTVYENIAFGTGASREEVQALLDRFEIDFASLDTPVGKGGSHLSGGQRQIIALMRAFLRRDAPLLLLDEPTAAFDPATRDRAMALVASIMEGRTTLLVTHDVELSRFATRIVTFPLPTTPGPSRLGR